MAGNDNITRMGLSAILTTARKKPAPTTVSQSSPTLNLEGPSKEAAIQRPKLETSQRTLNLKKKC